MIERERERDVRLKGTRTKPTSLATFDRVAAGLHDASGRAVQVPAEDADLGQWKVGTFNDFNITKLILLTI